MDYVYCLCWQYLKGAGIMGSKKVNNDLLGANAIKKLQKEQRHDDTEDAHLNADDILCKLLRKLGFASVVDEYHKIYKWYS